jgi:hypothetical protein
VWALDPRLRLGALRGGDEGQAAAPVRGAAGPAALPGHHGEPPPRSRLRACRVRAVRSRATTSSPFPSPTTRASTPASTARRRPTSRPPTGCPLGWTPRSATRPTGATAPWRTTRCCWTWAPP